MQNTPKHIKCSGVLSFIRFYLSGLPVLNAAGAFLPDFEQLLEESDYFPEELREFARGMAHVLAVRCHIAAAFVALAVLVRVRVRGLFDSCCFDKAAVSAVTRLFALCRACRCLGYVPFGQSVIERIAVNECIFAFSVLARKVAANAGLVIYGCCGAGRGSLEILNIRIFFRKAVTEHNIAAFECRFILRALARKSTASAGLIVLIRFRAGLAGNQIFVAHYFRAEVVTEHVAVFKGIRIRADCVAA